LSGDYLSENKKSEQARAEREARDLDIINRNAEQLNREALDALEYQAPLCDSPEE
jgi:hypothetical protein